MGSPVPSRDEQTEGFVGTADGRRDGRVSRRKDRRALPSHRTVRVFPADFPRDEIRDAAVTEGEVRLLLYAASKRCSAPGSNGVHYRILGESTGVLCARLSALYTACFREATFPTPWKEVNLVLLDKPGRDPTTPSAYRPIGLLDVERSFLPPNQCGFRVDHSTTDALDRV